MASAVQFTGLASGLDTASIIDAMLKADQTRIEVLQRRQSSITSQVSAIGTLRSKLSTLDSKLQAMRYSSQILKNKATTDDTTGILSATADSTAMAGSFKVTVSQLATATRKLGAAGVSDPTLNTSGSLATSGMATTPTAGKFTINGFQVDATGATSLDDFITAINAQTGNSGVQASYVLQGGNPVGIHLENDGAHLGQTITVGSAGDTSNFLKATKLDVALQAGDVLESTTTLGRVKTTDALSSAHLATAPAASGTLTINGVDIAWTNSESLQTVLTRINNSAANVSASYDQVADQVVLTSKNTGAQSITVSDTAGDLASVLKIDAASGPTETLGLNAQYSIDSVAGGAVQTSTSNSVTGVVAGVTVNLQKASATPVTVTVASDPSAPLAAMKEFVTAFNDVLDYVRTNAKPDDKGNRGLFQGDVGIRMLSDRLRTLATSAVSGLSGPYTSLADLGMTTGAVGAQVGTTNNLVLDESKFTAAFEANAQGVYDLLNNATAGSTGVFYNLRDYISDSTLPGGLLQTMTDTANTRKSQVGLEVGRQQGRLERRRVQLQSQFARMEAALAQIQSQGQRLQQQLGNLSGSQGE